MRLFVALRPSPTALEHLDAALEEVRDGAGRALRWGDPTQWHLTLAFRPDLPDGALEDAVRALSVYRGPTWEASELELVESVLGQGRSGGPRHEVLATVPLG